MQAQTTFRLVDDGTAGRQLAVTRILLERLADELEALELSIRSDGDLVAPDRDKLRDQVDEVMRLAFLALDELTPA